MTINSVTPTKTTAKTTAKTAAETQPGEGGRKNALDNKEIEPIFARNSTQQGRPRDDAYTKTLKARHTAVLGHLFSRGKTTGHIQGLDNLFENSIVRAACTPVDKFDCLAEEIVSYIRRSIEMQQPDIGTKVITFGSFLTALHDYDTDSHDLNVYIEYSPSYMQAHSFGDAMDEVMKALTTCDNQGSFEREDAKKTNSWIVPAISFRANFSDASFTVICSFGTVARNAYLSSKLVLAYMQIWPRAKHLALFVRKWARLLKLNLPKYGGFSRYALDLMVIHYLQQTKYLPVINEILREEDENEFDITMFCELPLEVMVDVCGSIAKKYYESEQPPSLSVGQMIHGFFTYFSLDFNASTASIEITSMLPADRPPENARYRRVHMFIQDPVTKRNACGGLRVEVFYHFMNCLTVSANYLCAPRLPTGPVYNASFRLRNEPDARMIDPKWRNCRFLLLDNYKEPPHTKELEKTLAAHQDFIYTYVLEPERLVFKELGYENPPVTCNFCEENHCEADCTLMNDLPEIPKGTVSVTLNFFNQLTDEITHLFEERSLSPERSAELLRYVESLKDELQAELGDELGDEIMLEAFGSLVNGFGTSGSDIDLCLRLHEGEVPKQGVESSEMMSKIYMALHRAKKNPEQIPGAKVPIIKFYDDVTRLRGDICMYNTLALHNSRLLKSYCEFDERVPLLGLAVKEWAKKCEINDASTGSISSYAYIIMVIHYLQRRPTPVIPFLQDAAYQTEGERRLVEDYDVTFADHTKIDRKKFKNEESIGQLLINFFRYYAEFDFDYEVIQVRTSKRLTKLDKGWYFSKMAIEDPFELGHNLTAVVKLSSYVRFKQCVHLTLLAMYSAGAQNSDVKDFSFANLDAPAKLSRPKTKCYRCGETGHMVRNCDNKRMPKGSSKEEAPKHNEPKKVPEAEKSSKGSSKEVEAPKDSEPKEVPEAEKSLK